jgi:3-oxoacyl-[acyl-carrier protein] reductase
MTLPLEKKLALVTGSSRGIGAAIARRLAADGASVLVHYGSNRDRAEAMVSEIKQTGRDAEAVGADLTLHAGPQALLEQVDKAFAGKFSGRLDVLVNNAGIVEFSSLMDSTDEAFDKQFNLHVRAVFQLSREAARRMAKVGWGRIINIGSVFGEKVPLPGVGLYSATKFAINGLTRGWSRDLGATGVTVNNVQPGPIDTELNPDDNGAMAEVQKKLTSLGRYGRAPEIAEAVAFLASPQAAFINGESLTVDGGWNA